MAVSNRIDSNPPARRAICGLFSRRERWSLSRRGWLALFALVCVAGLLTFFGIHPFLAPTRRVNSEFLVVEGWVDRHVVNAAVVEFNTQSYQRIFTTGGPVRGIGEYNNDFKTSASVAATRLKAAGAPADRVQMAPSRVGGRDRTYSSAVALREWLREHGENVTALNVLTEGVHARRSRLMFEKAFGKDVRIGIISVPNPEYDADRWWRYSEGVKEVVSEGTAYIYARFFFSSVRQGRRAAPSRDPLCSSACEARTSQRCPCHSALAAAPPQPAFSS